MTCLGKSVSTYINDSQRHQHTMSRRAGLKRKAAEEGEVKAKRARGETDLCDNLKWEYVGDVVKNVCPLLLLGSSTLKGQTKAAGFDIDFTVIKTASGRKFATGNYFELKFKCTNRAVHIPVIDVHLYTCKGMDTLIIECTIY